MKYEGDLQPLIDWVEWDYSTASTALRRHDEPPFMDFVREQLPDRTYHFWAGYNTKDTRLEGNWLHGFPHVHAWKEGTLTMVCYLTDCEGGELVVEDKEVAPEPGTCAFIKAHELHGVRPITEGRRLTVIVTGFEDA